MQDTGEGTNLYWHPVVRYFASGSEDRALRRLTANIFRNWVGAIDSGVFF